MCFIFKFFARKLFKKPLVLPQRKRAIATLTAHLPRSKPEPPFKHAVALLVSAPPMPADALGGIAPRRAEAPWSLPALVLTAVSAPAPSFTIEAASSRASTVRKQRTPWWKYTPYKRAGDGFCRSCVSCCGGRFRR